MAGWGLAKRLALVEDSPNLMIEPQEIVCKPTKWFLWRILAMSLMFAVGAFFFFKDWKWGYPEKNEQRFYYLAFESAKEQFKTHLESGSAASEWEELARSQHVFVPQDTSEEKILDVAPVLPKGTDLDTRWPDILADFDKYSDLYEKGSSLVSPPGWKEFTNSGGRAWDEKSDYTLKSYPKIQEQLYVFIGCLVLFLGSLFVLLRTMGRSMKVDAVGYYPPGGKLIPYPSMKRIDARKWDTKGLATVFFDRDGKEQKAKIDGMVYGQFKKEEGEPAQALYNQILANFKGEIIELVAEEDEEPAAAEEKTPSNDSE